MTVDPFDACYAFAREQEGGLANDKRDPGGVTNKGITLTDLRRWDRDATADDLAAIPEDETRALYRALGWEPIRGWALWPGLDLLVFDHGWNRGVGPSARILQRILQVQVDGFIGPVTALAARGVAPSSRRAVLEAIHDAQRADYKSLRQFDVFGGGWLGRADRRAVAALQLMSAPASV